jgi:phage tail-like protein
MPVIGAPRTYLKKYKFVVEVDGVAYAGFQSVSELSSEFAEVTQWEGGGMIPNKSPGRRTFDDVTLSRGAVLGDSDLLFWHEQCGEAVDNAGEVETAYKRNLDICQMDLAGNVVRRWRVFNAWPKRFVAGDWDNDSDDNVVESVTLSYDYFKKVLG